MIIKNNKFIFFYSTLFLIFSCESSNDNKIVGQIVGAAVGGYLGSKVGSGITKDISIIQLQHPFSSFSNLKYHRTVLL